MTLPLGTPGRGSGFYSPFANGYSRSWLQYHEGDPNESKSLAIIKQRVIQLDGSAAGIDNVPFSYLKEMYWDSANNLLVGEKSFVDTLLKVADRAVEEINATPVSLGSFGRKGIESAFARPYLSLLVSFASEINSLWSKGDGLRPKVVGRKFSAEMAPLIATGGPYTLGSETSPLDSHPLMVAAKGGLLPSKTPPKIMASNVLHQQCVALLEAYRYHFVWFIRTLAGITLVDATEESWATFRAFSDFNRRASLMLSRETD